MTRQFGEPVLDSELTCLNGWPEGTVDYNNDQALIQELNELCQKHGYGRVPQVALQIRDIWDYPEKIASYEIMRQDRLELLEHTRKLLNE